MVDTAVFSIFRRQMPDWRPVHDDIAADPNRAMGAAHLSKPDLPPAAEALQPTSSNAASTKAASGPDRPGLVEPIELAWLNVPVQHAFIGLANPAAWTVMASFSPAGPFEIIADSIGLYRPVDFRPAPWSGFAYDLAPDRRTGLVAGSRILTARGEIAIEDLLPGDTVMALRGPALLPILWIGRCIADEPPILIEAGALGEQRPSRSLYVAADHPIFVDPVPVPARRLVNGTTIRQTDLDAVELFHIDVGRHEVLFAQNLALASTQRPVAEPVQ